MKENPHSEKVTCSISAAVFWCTLYWRIVLFLTTAFDTSMTALLKCLTFSTPSVFQTRCSCIIWYMMVNKPSTYHYIFVTINTNIWWFLFATVYGKRDVLFLCIDCAIYSRNNISIFIQKPGTSRIVSEVCRTLTCTHKCHSIHVVHKYQHVCHNLSMVGQHHRG